ncbi:MAG: DUF1552 domain-containing protein, partial [Planctomycetes bacterium]|nr:DUF1552 domain-containing protein [Planctomycetota bacterium]
MKKSWQPGRRTVLKAAGVSMALPWLESMATAAPSESESETAPRRICGILFPYGTAVPKDSDPERDWGWFPTGEGKDYQLTNVLKPLEPLLDDLSIFGGLSHPNCRPMNGHDTGDTWLTANNLAKGSYRNTISLDQLAAQHIG